MRRPAIRLRRLLRSCPGPLREALALYLRGLGRRSSAQRFPDRKYWTVIPEILVRSRPAARRPGASFLDDVLWGQYCLFLSVRIHDDLLDGHVGGLRLRAAADLLYAQGRAAFARHFAPSSPFWSQFAALLAATREAIIETDALQRRLNPPGLLLRQYAKVAAVLKIGLAAVCISCDRLEQFSRIGRSFDALAAAGQILDDLEDFGEDLKRRRFNYVAALLSPKPEAGRSTKDLGLRLAGALLYGDGTRRVMRQVIDQLHRAESALEGARLPEVRRYLRTQRRNVARLSRALQSIRGLL